MDHAHAQLKDEEARRVSAVKTLAMAKKKIKDLGIKLTETNRERKTAEAALAGTEKQAKDQCQQLRWAEEQMVIAWEQIEAQRKELEKKEEALAQAEQSGYDIEVKKTEDILRARIIKVCRGYCLQVWT